MTPPARLAFVWARTDAVPVILGQVNFFLEFDVCFFRSRGLFDVRPKSRRSLPSPHLRDPGSFHPEDSAPRDAGFCRHPVEWSLDRLETNILPTGGLIWTPNVDVKSEIVFNRKFQYASSPLEIEPHDTFMFPIGALY